MNKPFLLIFLLVVFLVSCKKEIYKFNFSEKKRLNINELDFEYFQAKSKIKFDDGFDNFNATANFRIKKDSVIWMSISYSIGIEALRAIIRPDSIFVIDRINKQYNEFSFDSLHNKFKIPVDYNMLQSALLGNLINDRNSKDRVIRNEGFFILKQKNGHLSFENFVNSKTMKIEKVIILEEPHMNSLEIKYSKFQFINDKLLSYENVFQITQNESKSSSSTELNIGYNKISVDDKKMKFPFNIPNKYVSNE